MKASARATDRRLKKPVEVTVPMHLCGLHAGLTAAPLDKSVQIEAWQAIVKSFDLLSLTPDPATMSYRQQWGPPHNTSSRKVAAGAGGRPLNFPRFRGGAHL
jgi:hypothetical protein